MGWKGKLVVLLALVILICGILWLGFAVYARYQDNDYRIDMAAAFNAALLVNGDQTYTDPERAVICTYEGQRYVVLPDNYKAVVSLLRKDNAMPLFRRVGKDAPISIAICDSARMQIEPDRDSVDGALIAFITTGGKRYTMHVHGGNIWKQIVEYTTAGPIRSRNLPLGG